MSRRALISSLVIGASWWSGCLGGAPSPGGGEGPELSVNVAALNLEGVGDVVWDVEVVNGADPAQVVWQKRLASSAYGDGAGSAAYVGPCDADPAVNQNTVKVWVVGVYDTAVTSVGSFNSGSTADAGAVTGSPVDFQNPTTPTTPLTQVASCVANADVFVQFDVALMRPAQQGFFDIAMNFNNIFCSAKFDCCADPTGNGCAGDGSEDIELLFDASGSRATTMVLGFACTAGARAGVETELYLDALQLDCTTPSAESFGADITLNPSGAAGNQCSAGTDGMTSCTGVVTEANQVDADTYLFQLGVYRGFEQLTSGATDAQKVYWNVALGVRRPAIASCWLKTQGTADDANGTGVVATGNIAAGAVYPYVQWEVNLGTCGSEPLSFGDPGAMVRPEYTTTGDAGRGFAYGFGPSIIAGPFCAVACQNGGQCVSGACQCATGFSGPGCATNDDDCAGAPCGAGTCADGVASYTCTCPAGTFDDATTCTACTPITHCASGLTCATADDSVCATCDGGYVGSDCATYTCGDGVQNNGETGVDCGGPCAACPLQSLVPTLSSNASASPLVVSASSAHWNADLQPWKAFNKSWSGWQDGFCLDTASGWLSVDFGAQTTVAKYVIRGRDDVLGSSPRDWTFEGSNDAASWTTLDTQQAITWSVVGEYKEFSLSTLATYRYFRTNMSGNNIAYPITCYQEQELWGP